MNQILLILAKINTPSADDIKVPLMDGSGGTSFIIGTKTAPIARLRRMEQKEIHLLMYKYVRYRRLDIGLITTGARKEVRIYKCLFRYGI